MIDVKSEIGCLGAEPALIGMYVVVQRGDPACDLEI
jgi:hypothetical protein